MKKEAAVLSEASLACLGKQLGTQAVLISMYLNVPTYTIVSLQLTYEDQAELGAALMQQWRLQRALAKDKDKVNELERALRDNGKPEVADVVVDKHKDNQELTIESIPN